MRSPCICADPRVILVTGASSGIGAALAEAYAAPGTTLFLGGRDADRLAAVAGRCRDRGADVQVGRVDVADAAAMEGWVAACDAARPLDLVVANAGISAGTQGGPEGAADLPHPLHRRRAALVSGAGPSTWTARSTR